MSYIEGITLLETVQMQSPIPRIFAIIFAILSAIAIIYLAVSDRQWAMLSLLLLDIFLIVVSVAQIIEGPYVRYKVRIDDYAALPAIVEEYEIVESQGDIWYLEEKDVK
jgi:hypothetical protein